MNPVFVQVKLVTGRCGLDCRTVAAVSTIVTESAIPYGHVWNGSLGWIALKVPEDTIEPSRAAEIGRDVFKQMVGKLGFDMGQLGRPSPYA